MEVALHKVAAENAFVIEYRFVGDSVDSRMRLWTSKLIDCRSLPVLMSLAA